MGVGITRDWIGIHLQFNYPNQFPFSDKIYELVSTGMQDVNQIKTSLHCFVEGEFSLGANKDELSAILDQNNRAYYPTIHDIRNHMVSREFAANQVIK